METPYWELSEVEYAIKYGVPAQCRRLLNNASEEDKKRLLARIDELEKGEE